jgi:hypothetical protein
MGCVVAGEVNNSGHEPAGLDELLEADPEWQRIHKLVQRRAGQHSPFIIKRISKVRRCQKFQQYEAEAAKLGKSTELFHGTSLSSATRIAREGFKLPKHSGLYGPGLYFADDPNKSADYAPEASWLPFVKRWVANGFWDAVFNSDEGQMLLCDVYLGATKRCVFTVSDFDHATGLRSGWFRSLLGLGDYDSVTAPGWILSRTEYVVYREQQAVPRFFIEYELRK